MLREQIRVALEAARAISNHKEFVIAGSLSVYSSQPDTGLAR
jgi:hypothetical protein